MSAFLGKEIELFHKKTGFHQGHCVSHNEERIILKEAGSSKGASKNVSIYLKDVVAGTIVIK